LKNRDFSKKSWSEKKGGGFLHQKKILKKNLKFLKIRNQQKFEKKRKFFFEKKNLKKNLAGW
jgi:hypothetical protein